MATLLKTLEALFALTGLAACSVAAWHIGFGQPVLWAALTVTSFGCGCRAGRAVGWLMVGDLDAARSECPTDAEIDDRCRAAGYAERPF